MIIALASVDLLWENPLGNLMQCQELFGKAIEYNSDVIIFPEMTSTGFSVNNKQITNINGMQSFVTTFLAEIEKYNNLSAVFGHIEKEKNHLKNVLYAYNSHSSNLYKYSKSHLFSYANEQEIFTSDKELVIAQIKKLSVGLAICYDLRFPELFRQYRLFGIDACIVIANWPDTRMEHWFTLLQARAIENQMYMIGVNRTGTDDVGLKYEYSSIIFDPLGNRENPIDESGTLSFYELDLKKIIEARKKMPVILDIMTHDFGYKISNHKH